MEKRKGTGRWQPSKLQPADGSRLEPNKPWYDVYAEGFVDDLDLVTEPDVPEEPETPEWVLSAAETGEFKAALRELASRENEALRLYEPMPEQERFHASEAPERLILGGNRGGKTLAECVEIARAVTGQDPHGKYSLKDGRAIVVGADLRHCGQVIYRKLFRPGAFKVIRDPGTGKMRAFHPQDEWDANNSHLAKAAPPLIPRRFYRDSDISWETKREEIPKSIRIRATGWELNFFSSNAAPPQGWDADIAIFDEEIEHPSWYTEVAARLLDRRQQIGRTKKFINGRFWWGATPQAGTEHLYRLFEKAEAHEEDEDPPIAKFDVTLMSNTFMSEEAKQNFIDKFADSEDEYNVRVLGQFAIAGSRVYPELMPRGPHGCPSFVVPDNWTRYAAIDPGRQVCAVLFCAIPPPGLNSVELPDGSEFTVKGRKFLYDELYIKKCNAVIFAERLKSKVGTSSLYQMIIDNHAGRQTEMGSGITVETQYSNALKAARFSCEKTGYKFTWGADEKDAGILAVRAGLHLDGDGISEWCLMHEKLTNFIKESKNYCYKKLPGTNVCTDVPLDRANHLMDDWRYLAMAKLKYHKPIPTKRTAGYTSKALEAKKQRQKHKAKMTGTDGVKLW